jgi:hypothetical protein
MLADHIGIGGQIEHPPHPRDDRRQRRHVWKSHGYTDPVFVGRRNADHATVGADCNAAPVDVISDNFNAGNGALAEER